MAARTEPGTLIELASLPNLRAIGGYPARGGRVQTGVLYRSTALDKLAGVALIAIVTAAVTSSFVARAEEQRGADDATEDGLAAERLDARLQDITARLDRLERMLHTLSEQSRSAGGR